MKKFLIKVLTFSLILNLLFFIAYIVFFFNNVNVLVKKKEFVKTKVLVDSIRSGVANEEYHMKELKIYYNNPLGQIILKKKESIFNSLKENKYDHFYKYCMLGNDSIYVWHHPVLKDYYAFKADVSVVDRLNLTGVYISLILMLIGLMTMFFRKKIFENLK